MRKPFVAGNWKMNTTSSEAETLIQGLKSFVSDINNVDIAVCPPFVYLHKAVYLTNDSNIQVGAQNCYFESQGAFTGEIAPEMLKDVGCDFVILGHSERRHILGETDPMINQKVIKALDAGLEVVLCVGELLEEREAGKTECVVETQLAGGLKDVTAQAMSEITIAYEPVWAIGTGKTATPDQAQEVHAFIRTWLRSNYSPEVADHVRIQYGGSVKPENAKELMNQPDIDGALVGGASLKADSFSAIIRAAVQ
jgi:triosephosphate isomerase